MRQLLGKPGARGVLLLAILAVATAGLLASPVTAAGGVTKKQVKRIATAVATEVVRQLAYTRGEADEKFLQDDISVVEASTPVDSNNFKATFAICPSGKVLVGGGSQIVGASSPGNPPSVVALQADSPIPDPSGVRTRWQGIAQETTDTSATWGLIVHAICVSP